MKNPIEMLCHALYKTTTNAACNCKYFANLNIPIRLVEIIFFLINLKTVDVFLFASLSPGGAIVQA